MSKTEQDDSFASGTRRLTRALEQLETKATQLQKRLQNASDASDMDEDRARLAAELDEARSRAASMEDAAKEAGTALDDAIADVRAALSESGAS
ncbi:MAG: hypothetical protein COA47_04660 [Robiginitomaculum sp.]|nr:MAG: hypothetical protein COA47_04660 [Robiginitomaculum sp.]